MPRNFTQKCFTAWLDKNVERFNNPPCNINYKRGGIQFKLQGIIPEIYWELWHGSNMLFVSYKDNSFWDAIAECDVDEEKTSDGQYYNYWSNLEASEGGTKTIYYPTRKVLWEKEAFEQVLLLSNERTETGLYLCFFGEPDGSSWTYARVYPKDKIASIENLGYFLEAIPVNTQQ